MFYPNYIGATDRIDVLLVTGFPSIKYCALGIWLSPGYTVAAGCLLQAFGQGFPVDWGQEEKGTTEDEMTGWHHRLDGHEFK